MKLDHIYSFLLLIGLCYGYVSTTALKNNADFDKIESIRAFEWYYYQNLGEGGESADKCFLSKVIWPEAQFNLSSIKVIRLVATKI
jgi:hypothetical protein